MESAFKLDQTRRASDDSWKVCGQGALEQKGRRSRLFVLRAKPVLGLKSSHATYRQGINLQSKLRVPPGPSQPESLFGRLMVVSGW